MKYESNILKRLIDTYGVVGNPRYISEIIKEFIVQGKERFPNLFTYQADWLAHIDEFGLNPSYFVSYTGQSIYAPNTLERPVKRAILSGRTEVTGYSYNGYMLNNHGILSANGELTTLGVNGWSATDSLIKLESGEYYIEDDGTSGDGYTYVYFYTENGEYLDSKSRIDVGVSNTFNIDDLSYVKLSRRKSSVNNLKIYRKDDLKLTSVKMPVLTTTGKNLFDIENCGYITKNIDDVYIATGNGTTGSKGDIYFLKPDTRYTLQGVFKGWYSIFINDVYIKNGDGANNIISYTFTTSNEGITKIFFGANGEDSREVECYNIQLEEGSTATSYEPYKTNILRTPSDLELREIGDVQDTLDCLTGEVVQNIGEIVLDGSEDEEWTLSVSNSNFPNVLRVYLSNATDNSVIKNMKENSSLICDKFKVAKYADEPSIYITNGIDLHIPISTNSTIQQAREWLQQNQLTVQYELKTPSIKTVDLNILDQNGQNIKQLMSFNGGTHFNTGSLEGSLIPSVSVTVETDLEETLKVRSLEGNTM